jgi:hypothetical protein
MPKPTPDEVEKLKKKQNDMYDEPDEAEVGVDVEEDLERVIGNEPDDSEEGFSIAEEVEKDEEAIRDDKPEGEFRDEAEEVDD